MRREFQLWTLDSQWRNVRNLFADKNFNFIPWFWLQSKSQWGWGESWVSSLYLPPHYGHNNVTRLPLPANQGTDMFSVQEWGPYFFGSTKCFWWVVIIKLTFGKHASKGNQNRVYNPRAEPEMANFKRILLGGEWSIWPRNKISTSILLLSSGHQHVMGQESGLGCQEDVRMTCHYWSLCQLRLTAA